MSQAKSDSILLNRVILKVSPDIFCHPIWVGFLASNRPAPQTLIGNLVAVADQYKLNGDIICACQILLLCAYLHKIKNNFEAAIDAIEQTRYLAEKHGLKKALIWSFWGGASISLAKGDNDRAIDYLAGLQDLVDLENDWVLYNVIDLLKRTLGKKEKSSVHLDRFQKWLYLWGESPCKTFLDSDDLGYQDDQLQFQQPGKSQLWIFSRKWRTLKKLLKAHFHQKRSANDFPSQNKVYCLHNSQEEIQVTPRTSSLLGKGAAIQDKEHRTEIEARENSSQEPERNFPQVTLSSYKTLISSPAESPFVAVYCLGDFRVYQDHRLVENWPSRKGLSVFKYLVLQHPTPVAKEILMDTIWPDADLEAARRNLHQAIYSIRQTLKNDQPHRHLIIFENDAYLLNPDIYIWRDYEEFEIHVKKGNRSKQDGDLEMAIQEYSVAESLYQGDFMAEDLYESGAQTHRQYLWQTYISIAHHLADYHRLKENYLATSVLCRRILEMDNCQEEAHRNLMKCFWAQGQRHLAISQYHICVRNLQTELEISPSDQTQNLYRSILNGQE